MNALLRLVVDTAVVVAAYRSKGGASAALIGLVLQGHIQLIATPVLFLEYEAVLERPEHMRVHGMTLEEVDHLLDLLALIAVPARLNYQWRPQLSDPGDEHVLEAAINGHADAIVTFNVRDFLPAAASLESGWLNLELFSEREVSREQFNSGSLSFRLGIPRS